MVNQCAQRLRQAGLALLTPPKLHGKGRCQSISTLGQWADKTLDVFAVQGRARKGGLLAELRTALPSFIVLKPFVKRFASATQVMGILKNKGLDQISHERCYQPPATMPKNPQVKKHLQQGLRQHLDVQKQLTDLPLLVSGDIIGPLFGNFKHIIGRGPQADMNRTALLIPAPCGRMDKTTIDQALNQARHNGLEMRGQENIPCTARKKRQAFFDNIGSQKAGQTWLGQRGLFRQPRWHRPQLRIIVAKLPNNS